MYGAYLEQNQNKNKNPNNPNICTVALKFSSLALIFDAIAGI
jgi:hypothetical protein